MSSRKAYLATLLILVLSVVSLFGVLAACASGSSSAAIKPTKRTLFMAAIEPKGSTSVDKEPFPAAGLPEGGGYILKAPNKEGTWEVSSYRWTPSTLVVYQGDEVSLEILGINGKEHPTVIEGYDVNFKVLRGQVTQATFKADKVGVFNIVCAAHLPSMVAQLVVLPRG